MTNRDKYRFMDYRHGELLKPGAVSQRELTSSESDDASTATRDALKRARQGRNVSLTSAQFRLDVMRTVSQADDLQEETISTVAVQTA